MDKAGCVGNVGFDSDLFGILNPVACEPFIFGYHRPDGHRILRLLSLCFLDEILNPTRFIAIPLEPESLIYAHRLAKEFAPRPAFFPGEGLNFFLAPRAALRT